MYEQSVAPIVVFQAKSLNQTIGMALARAVEQAKNGKVLWVDCLNAFDPYAVLRLCSNRLEAKQRLENILISRPFTIYQLQRLAETELFKTAVEQNIRLVVFLGLTELFVDEDVNEQERIVILNQIRQHLQRFSVSRQIMVAIYLTPNAFSDYFKEGLIWAEP